MESGVAIDPVSLLFAGMVGVSFIYLSFRRGEGVIRLFWLWLFMVLGYVSGPFLTPVLFRDAFLALTLGPFLGMILGLLVGILVISTVPKRSALAQTGGPQTTPPKTPEPARADTTAKLVTDYFLYRAMGTGKSALEQTLQEYRFKSAVSHIEKRDQENAAQESTRTDKEEQNS